VGLRPVDGQNRDRFLAPMKSPWWWLLGCWWAISLPAVTPTTDDLMAAQAQVLDALDAEQAAMQAVHEIRAQDGDAAAMAALLAYFAERPMPVAVLPSARTFPPGVPARAEAAMRDEFNMQGVTAIQPRTPEGGLDWHHRGPRNDPEWAWLLNRHRHFSYLIQAARESWNPAYVHRVEADLVDWIVTNPYPNRTTFSASWRALEVARRMLEVWIQLWDDLKRSPHFSDEARTLMLASFLDHGDALREHASIWGGNHLVTEKTALIMLARAFPEFTITREWLDYAATAATTEILDQTYPDGAYQELTNHYQWVVLRNAQRLKELLEPEADLAIYPAFAARVEAMWQYFIHLAKPSGYGPLNNASDEEHNREFTRQQNPEALNHAESASIKFFPYAGHVIERFSPSPSPTTTPRWSFFDVGPYGTAHQHQDRLHFSMSAAGRDWLVDNGRYTYQPGKWRDYFKGPHSHNTLTFNGDAAQEGPLSVEQPVPTLPVSLSQDWPVVAGEALIPPSATPGHLPGRWVRIVVYAPFAHLVLDVVESFAPLTLQARWHFHPDVTTTEAAQVVQYVSTASDLFKRDVYRGQEAPFVAGWRAPQYNERFPAVEQVYTWASRQPHTTVWWLQTPEADGKLIELETVTARSWRITYQSASEAEPMAFKVTLGDVSD